MIRQEFTDALRDENGLLPTAAALDVLTAVLMSIDYTDETWPHRGVPSAVDYARGAVRRLEHDYLEKG